MVQRLKFMNDNEIQSHNLLYDYLSMLRLKCVHVSNRGYNQLNHPNE